MKQAVFEFPLNEKVRNYLRIEHLFNCMADPSVCCKKNVEVGFLRNLFQLLDLIERVDMKTELLRDLKTYRQVVKHWSELEGVDLTKVNALSFQIENAINDLNSAGRIGCSLKKQRFLAAIRNRFAIPGATCSFDLPKLHHWLHLPEADKVADMESWLAPLTVLKNAVCITLDYLRQRQPLTDTLAPNGFYQGVADAKVELIRVVQGSQSDYYPTLSGNKYRYAVRFMQFSQDEQNERPVGDIQFQMACC